MTGEKQLQSAAKASFWYTVCGVIQRALGLIIVPVFTRLMSEGDYGIYSLAQSWFYIVSILATLNLGEYVFYNGLTKFKSDQEGFSSSMLGLSSLTTIICLVVFGLFPGFWSNLLGMSAPVVALILVRCLVSPSYLYWSAKLRYEYKYKAIVALTVCLTIATPLISIPVILVSEDKALAALVCQVIVMAVVYLVPCASILAKSRRLFNKRYWRFSLKFNIPLLPHFIALIGLQQIGRIVINYMMGAEAAAVFSVAYSAAMVVTVVSNAIVQSLIPLVYKCLEERDYRSINKSAVAGLMVVGGSCCLLVTLAPEAMAIMAPASYQEGVAMIPTLCATVVLMFLFNQFANIEYYYEETGKVAVASLVAAISDVAFTVFLVGAIGPIGAAYASLLCYGVFCIGHYALMRIALAKHNKGVTVLDAKLLVACAAACVIAIHLISLLYPFEAARYLVVLIAIVVAFAKRNTLIGFLRRQ